MTKEVQPQFVDTSNKLEYFNLDFIQEICIYTYAAGIFNISLFTKCLHSRISRVSLRRILIFLGATTSKLNFIIHRSFIAADSVQFTF